LATQKPILIGIYSPKPQSGKSTLAAFMAHNFGFEHRSISQPIKFMLEGLLISVGLPRPHVERLMREDKEKTIPELGGRSFRELCQSLGTDWGRKLVQPRLWLEIALQPPSIVGRSVVIDDVRFVDEYWAIKEQGGEVWRIDRPLAPIPSKHESEGQLEDMFFDRHFTNDSSKEKLFRQLIYPNKEI